MISRYPNDIDNIKITPDCIALILQNIAFADLSDLAGTIVPAANRPRLQLSPGFRYVHAEGNGIEREPEDGEPYTIVERRGDFEYCMLPTFRSFHGIHLVRPRLEGSWDITELSEEKYDDELESGQFQGWAWWIRLARGV